MECQDASNCDYSSTKTEYQSLALTTVGLYWLRKLFQEIQIPLLHVSTLWCDIVSALALASNLVYHARTKCDDPFFFLKKKNIQMSHYSGMTNISPGQLIAHVP
jgi:hypothetical protein